MKLLLTTIAAVVLVGCGESPSKNKTAALPSDERSKIEMTHSWYYGHKAAKRGFPTSLRLKIYNGSSWVITGWYAKVKYTKDDGEVVEREYYQLLKEFTDTLRPRPLGPTQHGTSSTDLIWFYYDDANPILLSESDFNKRVKVVVLFIGYPA